MKPGYKTTEFWLSIAAMVVGAVLASGAVSNELVLQALGVVATVLGSLGYSVTRGVTKAGDSKAAAASAALYAMSLQPPPKLVDPTLPPPSQPG